MLLIHKKMSKKIEKMIHINFIPPCCVALDGACFDFSNSLRHGYYLHQPIHLPSMLKIHIPAVTDVKMKIFLVVIIIMGLKTVFSRCLCGSR